MYAPPHRARRKPVDEQPKAEDRRTARAMEFHRRWHERERAGASDSDLVALAFEHCNAMVLAVATRLTGSDAEAEDISQSVFELLARKLHTIREPARIPGFLKTCTVRRSLDVVRRRKRRRARADLLLSDDEKYGGSSEFALAASVHQMLDMLTRDERAAVVLKHVDRHTHAEVASLMEISVATVRRRLEAARHKVDGLMGDGRAFRLFDQLGDEVPSD